MPDPFTLSADAERIENTIRACRLFDLSIPWNGEIIYPHYTGLSIINVMQSILGWFGVRVTHPLDRSVFDRRFQSDAIQRIVVYLTDGLGYRLLSQLVEEDAELRDIIATLTEGRGFVPLTSTAPSTTAVALPTLWTAHFPATHGMLGTMMYIPDFTTLGNMLAYMPAFGQHKPGAFVEWGADPEGFVPVKTVAEQLGSVGVSTHLLLDKGMMGSGLSRMMHRGVQDEHRYVHAGTHDIWMRLHDVLSRTAGQRCYVNVYWPVVDTLSHLYGAQSTYVKNEIKYQMRELRTVLASDRVRDGQTLVLIFADHGHYDAPTEINLNTDQRIRPIRDAMRGAFGGDARFAQLYLRAGKVHPVINVLNQDFQNDLAWIEPEAALQSGLFGTGDVHPQVMARLGDLIIIARQGIRLSDTLRPKKAVSIHGGLSDWEMLVPFMWKQI